MTTYKCRGCGLVFEGYDPIRLDGYPEPWLPKCPKAALAIEDIFARANHSNYEAFERTRYETNRAMTEHCVAVAEEGTPLPPPPATRPQPQGAWAKPLAIKPESEAEKKLREDEARTQAKVRESENDARLLAERARQLVHRIERAIQQQDGVRSVNFPDDLEYGMKDSGKAEEESVEVIQKAADLWRAKGSDYSYRGPAYKKTWTQSMANFELSRKPGDRVGGGKHNFHVTVRT